MVSTKDIILHYASLYSQDLEEENDYVPEVLLLDALETNITDNQDDDNEFEDQVEQPDEESKDIQEDQT